MIQVMDDWATDAKMEISELKTALVLLKGKFDGRQKPRIRGWEGYINFSESFTYLGVTLGPLFSISPHLDFLMLNLEQMNAIMSRLPSVQNMGFKMR